VTIRSSAQLGAGRRAALLPRDGAGLELPCGHAASGARLRCPALRICSPRSTGVSVGAFALRCLTHGAGPELGGLVVRRCLLRAVCPFGCPTGRLPQHPGYLVAVTRVRYARFRRLRAYPVSAPGRTLLSARPATTCQVDQRSRTSMAVHVFRRHPPAPCASGDCGVECGARTVRCWWPLTQRNCRPASPIAAATQCSTIRPSGQLAPMATARRRPPAVAVLAGVQIAVPIPVGQWEQVVAGSAPGCPAGPQVSAWPCNRRGCPRAPGTLAANCSDGASAICASGP
jgi:hypothetical protein